MELERRRSEATGLARHRTGGRIRDEIPTTSMADIAFLLVVFFMLTVTFASGRGLDYELAREEEATTVDPVHSVHVRVLPDGSLRVDRRQLALGDLTGYLRPRLERDPGKPVILETDPAAPYGAMVRVYDQLRRTGRELDLPQGLVIAVPTQREAERFWH